MNYLLDNLSPEKRERLLKFIAKPPYLWYIKEVNSHYQKVHLLIVAFTVSWSAGTHEAVGRR